MSPKRRSSDPKRVLMVLIVGLGVTFALCCACWGAVSSIVPGSVSTTPAAVQKTTTALRLAYSPEKQVLFEKLVADFNAQKLNASAGGTLQVEAVQMDPETMVDAALAGDVQAIVPDSSVWLDVLDRTYGQRATAGDVVGSQPRLTSEVTRWGVSPVVIAMWEDTARQMGWPDRPISWKDLLTRAQTNPDFKWSHPATNSASGLLATLAEFYAGAGVTRGLTEEMANSQAVTEYVGAIEKTVRFYGEGEWATVQRTLQEGNSFLDAFVAQEQLVIYFNRQANRPGKLVAIYPAEGTLWEDHPLALIESQSLTPLQRETYGAFRQYLTSQPVQERVLEAGYRPADLSIPIDGPTSPINAANGADPAQPQTTLQVPGPAVVQAVRDVWWLTKRHTNVYLVADTSGSMAGDKLSQAQDALVTFIGQIKGDTERVGLIAFSSSVYQVEELDTLGSNRARLLSAIGGLEARGDTALLDAVTEGYGRLQKLHDTERINAIVVMTDGKENNSYTDLRQLVNQIKQGNQSGVPVVIFCIAYGSDADMDTLQSIATASGGQVRTGDPETIRNLYKILSTYF
jgi:Ca-activated chloride channel family protein